MDITLTSDAFKITLPSGTNLFGITKTRFEKNNNTLSNGITAYFTEISKADYDQLNSDPATARLTETIVPGAGAGAPKFYKQVGIFNRDGDRKFVAGTLSGAELQQEFAKFNTNSSQSPALNTVVAAAVNKVARNQGVDPSVVSSSIFGSNVATSSQPTELIPESIQTNIPLSGDSEKINESLAKADFVYPTEMRTNQQDRIKFTALSIEGRENISTNITERDGVANFSLGNRKTMMLGSVTLPIQPSITDSNGVDWGGTNLDPITAYAASKSLDVAAAGNITAAAAKALNEAAKDFKDQAGLKQAISIFFASKAVGAQNLLSRTSGAIVNPNLELLFNGPTLRPFNFTFRLSPRDEDEAKEVKAIINFFKKAMAVKKAKSEIFLKAPNIFKIQYFRGNGGEEHKSLNRIKDCALLGCDIDYTPDGSYMTFNSEESGYPMTSYQMTLRFSELDPIYDIDYAKFEEGEIGF